MRWWRKRRPEDFDAEIRAHLELEQDELEWRGLKPEEARDAARRAFGNVTATRERYHERGRLASWDSVLKDAGYAARMLRKSTWFTASAVAILAVAIGANLTVFALIDGVMLRSIPVSRPEELVRLDPSAPQGRVIGLPSTVLEPLAREAVFSGVCGFATPRISANLNGAIAHTNVLAMSGTAGRRSGWRRSSEGRSPRTTIGRRRRTWWCSQRACGDRSTAGRAMFSESRSRPGRGYIP
jgi:hypothetical protein